LRSPRRGQPRRRPGRSPERTRGCCASSCSIATPRRSCSTSQPGLRCRAARTPGAMSMACSTPCASTARSVRAWCTRLDKDTSGVSPHRTPMRRPHRSSPEPFARRPPARRTGRRLSACRNCCRPDRSGARQTDGGLGCQGSGAGPGRRGWQERGHLLPGDGPCRRPGELARALADHRADPPAARPLRRARHADHGRRQIWRQRRSLGGYRCSQRAAPACPNPCHSEPGGGILQVTAPLPPHMRETWDLLGFASDSGDPFAELESPR